jgi:hypothetical protein
MYMLDAGRNRCFVLEVLFSVSCVLVPACSVLLSAVTSGCLRSVLCVLLSASGCQRPVPMRPAFSSSVQFRGGPNHF